MMTEMTFQKFLREHELLDAFLSRLNAARNTSPAHILAESYLVVEMFGLLDVSCQLPLKMTDDGASNVVYYVSYVTHATHVAASFISGGNPQTSHSDTISTFVPLLLSGERALHVRLRVRPHGRPHLQRAFRPRHRRDLLQAGHAPDRLRPRVGAQVIN